MPYQQLRTFAVRLTQSSKTDLHISIQKHQQSYEGFDDMMVVIV